MTPLIIGIAGGTGSGKSAVARAVVAGIGAEHAALLEMDAYYRDFSHLTATERDAHNWDHPASFEFELLAAHLSALAGGQSVEAPQYDFARHGRAPTTTRIEPRPAIIVEGILVLHDAAVRERCDMKIFVDTDADIRLLRRIRRDTVERGRTLESVLDQYLQTVQPMHLQFVEPSKRYADVIVPRGGSNTVAIEMIVARIRHRLGLTTDVSYALAAPGGA